MKLKGKTIGFALTGSHCTYEEIWPQLKRIRECGAEIIPVVSEAVAFTDTRFGRGEEIVATLADICGREPIMRIVDAEPVGPKRLFDCMVIAPCTGNTTAKLANAITDSPVLMAAKAQIRNERPVVLAISTNDGLGLNAKNIGILLNARHVYFVPFGQDNPQGKTRSLVADMNLIVPTVELALEHKQIQPIIIERTIRAVK